MQIQVRGDDSINQQALTYAEYRLFAAVSEVFDVGRVHRANLELRSVEREEGCPVVHCVATVDVVGGERLHVSTRDAHPYAAINRAVEWIRDHKQRIRINRARETDDRRVLS
ncbi:MAG: hypothetical protein AB7O67_04915 [Vicinamibacterales bacterium]